MEGNMNRNIILVLIGMLSIFIVLSGCDVVETQQSYEVIFEDYDGTILKTDDVTHGQRATAPTEPLREGYTFIGWDQDFTEVTEPLTIKAWYEINVYRVDIHDLDGLLVDSLVVTHGTILLNLADYEDDTSVVYQWFVEGQSKPISEPFIVESDLSILADWHSKGLDFDSYLGGYEVGLGSAAEENIKIPAYYNSRPVLKIADYGFEGSAISEVDIPYTVERIGVKAFQNATNLNQVYFADNSRLVSIEWDAFAKIESLKTIRLPEGLKSLGQGVFYLSGLEVIILPSTLNHIGPYALTHSWALSEIVVSNDNPYFSSKDGVLYTKDFKELLVYPSNRETWSYSVHPSTQSIAGHAFDHARVRILYLPDSLRLIENFNFVGGHIESIVFKEGVSEHLSFETETFLGARNNLTMYVDEASLTRILAQGNLETYGFNLQFKSIGIQDLEDKTHKVTINDLGLIEALSDNGFNISINGEFLPIDAIFVKELHAAEYRIHSIEGLEYFSNLEFIDLRGNFLTSLKPLTKIESLKVIKVANNRLNDSYLYDSNTNSYVDELIKNGVQVHNYLYQQVSPTTKNEKNTNITWKTLIVIVKDVEIVKDERLIKSSWVEGEINEAIKNVDIFYHAINHLVPDHVYVDVDIYVTNQLHQGDINVINMDSGPTYWLWPEHINEIKHKLDEYYSIIVLHQIENNDGYAGLGFYNSGLRIGSASVRYEIFRDIENMLFETDKMEYYDKVNSNFMSYGTLVLIHEFIHGLEFYGIYGLNLQIWDLHDSAYHYDEMIDTDYGNFNFDRSLTRDYLWYLGYLRGDINPANPNQTGVVDDIWENPPR